MKLLFAERWFKDYEDSFEACKDGPGKVRLISDHMAMEQAYAYLKLLEFDEIGKEDIAIKQPEAKVTKGFKLGESFVIEKGRRIYDQNDKSLEPYLEGIEMNKDAKKQSAAGSELANEEMLFISDS